MLETGKWRKGKKEQKRILNLPQGGLYPFHRVCSLQNLLCKFGHMPIHGVVPAHATETHHTSSQLALINLFSHLPPCMTITVTITIIRKQVKSHHSCMSFSPPEKKIDSSTKTDRF